MNAESFRFYELLCTLASIFHLVLLEKSVILEKIPIHCTLCSLSVTADQRKNTAITAESIHGNYECDTYKEMFM